MGNEISGRQYDVSKNYNIPLHELRRWYHEHYINFLKDEIQKKTWQNGKYEKHMKDKDGKTIHKLNDKFCKWKDIQREIFEATLDNHRFLLYSWEERAKKFIDDAEVENRFSGAKCDNDDKKSEDDENSATTPPSTPDSSGQNIDLKGCLPSRRKNINKRLYNVRNLIENINKGDGSESSKAQIAATNIIGSLALQTENEIDEFFIKSSHNMDDVCKLLGRTYADYKDISKGKDVVEHHVSQDIQKSLKVIVENIGGETKMDEMWKAYFKDKIEKKLKEVNNYKKGSKSGNPCTLDHSDETKPQCLRYMQEFLEEFIETKNMLQWSIQKLCNSTKRNEKNKCTPYCKIYSDILKGRKTCYQKYKTECQKNLKDHYKYSKKEVYELEVKEIEKKIKDKSGCGDTCGNDFNVDLNPLFDGNDPNTNKSYFCYCENGKGRNTQPPCSDQQQKSTMSLEGNWKDGIYKTQTKPGQVCGLQFKDHNSTGGDGEDPCAGVYSNSSWNCNETLHEGICMPPRRHEICISNIRRLREGDINGMDSHKLLLEVMLAAKQQTWRLRTQGHKGRPQSHNVCDAIKLSFLDFGDIIKGTDRAKDAYSVTTENNLKAIFEKIREQWTQNGNMTYDDSTATSDGLSQLRSDWWDANKKNIWEAFKCGNSCNNAVPQDNRSQFLRWLDEWATEFCAERKNKEQAVNVACQPCGNDCEYTFSWSSILSWFSPPGNICDCKNKCREYSEWIHKKKKEFDTQKKYYDEKLTIMDFGNNSSVTTTRGGSTSGTSITSVSDYLKDKVKYSCTHVDFSNPETMFSSYPDDKSKYRHKCSRCYPQLEADLADKGGPKKDVCDVKDILTESPSNITHECNTYKTKPKIHSDDTEWKNINISNKNIGSNGNKVAVPPRYEDICKDTIDDSHNARSTYMSSHDFYYNNRMLLSELILVGQHEGKSLREHYIRKNDNSVLCTSMRRSFSDIADIVRGTNLVDTDNSNQVEQHLKDMFNKLRDEYKTLTSTGIYDGDDGLMKFRKHWWETNRHMIWGAFACGDRNNHSCNDHMDMDKVPQLLRWITEWSEKFCKAQKEQYTKLKNECEECKNGKCNGKKKQNECQRCKTQCDKYKEFVKKWLKQWKTYEKMYSALYTNSMTKLDATTDDNISYMQQLIRDWKTSILSAATYVEGTTTSNECETQKEFGSVDSNKYAFKEVPEGFVGACDCEKEDKSKSDSPSGGGSGSEPKKTKLQNICEKINEGIGYVKWDCGKVDNQGNKVCMKKENNNVYEQFYDLFNSWVKSFLDEHKKFDTQVKECTNGASNTCSNDCINKCYCYKKWINRRKLEWNKQKEYYEKYYEEYKNSQRQKNAGTSQGTGGIDDLGDIDTYLTALIMDENPELIQIDSLNGFSGGKKALEDKLSDAINKANDCVEKCPKKLECHEKGFESQWKCDEDNKKSGTSVTSGGDKICVKKGDENKYNVANLDKVKEVNKFYDTFNYWLDDMERTIDEYLQILEQSCHGANKKQTARKAQGSARIQTTKACILCKDDCDCYDKWKTKINEQWTKQKGYYNTYRNKDGNDTMKDIDMDTYLEAKCELDTSSSGSTLNNSGRNKKYCHTKTSGSGSNGTMFDEFLKTMDNKKDTFCQKCKDTKGDNETPPENCDKIQNISDNNCKEKKFDEEKNGELKTKWKCEKTIKGEELKDYSCVPPRGQKLCIANMVNSNGKIVASEFSNEENLKNELKSAIKKETERLHEYYNGKYKSTSGEIPSGFCDAVYRSFNDFKNLVTGQMLWKPINIKTLEDKIGQLIQHNGGTSITTATTREQWWKSHEKDFWNAVKCGIQEAKKGNTGKECPRFIHDEDYDTQFYWWFREWGDDFCSKKKKLKSQLDSACKDESKRKCDSKGQNIADADCKNSCEDYKKLITDNRQAWKKFSEKFNKEEETKDEKNKASYNNSSFYLLFNCDDCNGTNFGKVFKDTNIYGDYQTTCTCISSTSSQKSSDDIKPCDDNISTSNCRSKNKNNKWNTTMIKNPDKYKVYGPPRRQKLCLGNLYGLTGGENPKLELEKELYGAAKIEATFLREQHKNDSTTVCKAIERSFYDFGDIIKGTDMMKGRFGVMVEKELNEIFANSDTSTSGGGESREEWWDKHKDKVWKAMNCDNKCGSGTSSPSDEKPQFLRWLEEWAEQICTERQKLLENLQRKCKTENAKNNVTKDTKCTNATPECKKQCKVYNDWINTHRNEWKGQKTKYDEIYIHVGDHDEDDIDDEYKDYVKYMNGKTTAMEYIEPKCQDKNLDDVFKKIDQEYKEYEPFCTECRIKDIADTVKKKQNSATINPCGGNLSGTKPGGKTTTSVTDIAKTFQQKAKEQMETNSGSSGSVLKGDAKKGTYNRGGTASALKDICSITIQHSNDVRGKDYKGPCTGKNPERFKIGNDWSHGSSVNRTHQDIYLPPRRQHFCTSNLENLKDDGKSVKDGHSLLGDVLLSAYKEAEFIKTKYNNPSDHSDVCRAIKYSFADIGDIIKGTDLWKENSGEQKTQGNLKRIFSNIHNSLSNKDKYTDTSSYLDLRKDWWEANRDEIWKAMKCPKSGANIQCDDKNSIPVDDYIPQRLRWMTEWTEWFCKAQKDEYAKLVKVCESCKDINADGKCPECAECKAACGTYKNFINKWRLQWETQSNKYKELYDKAKQNVSSTSGTTDEKDVVEFLKQLHEKNNENTTYSTAAGYVHQELKNMDCNTQKVFCNNDTSGAPLNSGSNDVYAFRDPPHEYDKACNCKEDPPKPPPQPPAQRPDPKNQVDPNTPIDGTSQGGSKPSSTPTIPNDPSSGKPSPSAPAAAGDKDGGGRAQPDSGGSSGPPGSPPSKPDSSGSGNVAPSPNPSTPGSDPGKDGGAPSPGGQPSSPGPGGGSGNPGSGDPNQNPQGGGGGSGKSNYWHTNRNRSRILPPRPKPPDISDTELEPCPLDQTVCTQISTSSCNSTKRQHHLDDWNTLDLKDRDGKNKGVIIPPRRKHICFSNINKLWRGIKSEDDLKRHILGAAASEAKYLSDFYKKDEERDMLLDAMKYSFADIGNIIKGDDMVDDMRSKNVTDIFRRIYTNDNNGTTNNVTQKRKDWWEKNKKHLWNVMMCYYNGNDKDKKCKEYDTIDKTPQFLRWLTEWSQQFCIEKVNEAKNVVILKECLEQVKQNGKSNDTIMQSYCKNKLDEYRNWYAKRKDQWDGLKKKYEKLIKSYSSSGTHPQKPKEQNANEYVKSECKECDCEINSLDKIFEEQENNNDTELLKTLIDRAKIDSTEPPKKIDPISPIDAFQNLVANVSNIAQHVVKEVIPDSTKSAKLIENVVDGVFHAAAKAKEIVEKMKQTIQEQQNNSPTPVSPAPAPTPTPPTPSTPTTSSPEIIVGPVVGAVAATILGILLYKWKKPFHAARYKRDIDMFRVLEMPQNEYGIPTNKSSNRYVPYGRYKGKTYIYVEGEESDDYIRDISSSDITSSSESEVEEVDINDIYGYKSPKYKTLIEVVLKPSNKTHDVQNTHIDNIVDTTYIPSGIYSDKPSDIPTNTPISDEEWNQLKQDFISQYLENIPKVLPDENLSGTPTTDTQPDTVDSSMDEKPFITSIQDRYLHGDSDVFSYNINWNIPKNTQIYTTDYPKYVSNDLYSGIDLINDSLNSDQHIDIYDELLKRKENESFGTNHTKHTTTNIFATQTYTDTIMKQLELFHKWLDRHRNMCNQWNNKKYILNKLKEKWDMENNNRNITLDSNSNTHNNDIKMLNTDISIQIDMDVPKTINEFTNINTNPDNSTMDNILDDLENYIYYDVDDDQISVDHNKVHMEMSIVNNKKELCQQEYPI